MGRLELDKKIKKHPGVTSWYALSQKIEKHPGVTSGTLKVLLQDVFQSFDFERT
jgi:hypothetical protein